MLFGTSSLHKLPHQAVLFHVGTLRRARKVQVRENELTEEFREARDIVGARSIAEEENSGSRT